jgi:hypothetical protein
MRTLSGFLDLVQSDQIQLIKACSFEVLLVEFTPIFTEDRMFVPTMDMRVPKYVKKTKFDPELQQRVLEASVLWFGP